jgi:hypothetical protein
MSADVVEAIGHVAKASTRGELEVELKQRDVRIAELTKEREKQRKANEESRKSSHQWYDAYDACMKRCSR